MGYAEAHIAFCIVRCVYAYLYFYPVDGDQGSLKLTCYMTKAQKKYLEVVLIETLPFFPNSLPVNSKQRFIKNELA